MLSIIEEKAPYLCFFRKVILGGQEKTCRLPIAYCVDQPRRGSFVAVAINSKENGEAERIGVAIMKMTLWKEAEGQGNW
jgi:hypothetical protein